MTNIADRIQKLRKEKGISQEELASQIGVSRQAVSKWESKQSVPDLDKVVILSEYFGVTTDYLIKGIENEEKSDLKEDRKSFADINFNIVGTAINIIGLIISIFMFYSTQEIKYIVIGLVIIVLGITVFYIGIQKMNIKQKKVSINMYWKINIWIVSFIPLSLIYNLIISSDIAPYPLIYANTYITFILFWIGYIILCEYIRRKCINIDKKGELIK